jgi:hypothetical protein
MDGDTRGLGARVGGGRSTPSRRLVLLGGAGSIALLAGCGLRLDLPQPPPPVPTRRPATDESLLLAVVTDVAGLVTAAGQVLARGDDPDASTLRTVRAVRSVLRSQLTVVRGRLTNAGVPTRTVDAAARAVPGTAAVRSAPALASRLDAVGAAQWQRVAAASADTRRLLTTAYAARLASGVLLGGDVALSAPSPARPAVVARTQPLVYAFEVVAAQSSGRQRRTAETTLEALTRLEAAVSGSGTNPPAGWSLPFPVTSSADASRLATHTLSAAVETTASLAGTSPTAAALEGVARWSAHVQALATRWDLPLTAFPGATT